MSTNAPPPHAPAPPPSDPVMVGVRVGPMLPLVLYAVLVASAGLALWSQRSPEAPAAVAASAPWIFLVFAVGFAAYRLSLVMARRYSAFKAFVQVLIAAMFFVLLTGPVVPGLPPPTLASQLTAVDPQVRALAAEVAGFRGTLTLAPRLVPLLNDPSPAVREAAHQALIRMNAGQDLGGPDAAEAWRTRFHE